MNINMNIRKNDASSNLMNNRSNQLLAINQNKNVNNTSGIGEKKRLKVQFIQINPNTPAINTNIQINPKTWPNLKENNLIEISLQSTLVLNSSNASNLANIGSSQLNSSLNRSSNNSVVSSSISTNIQLQQQQQSSQSLQQQNSQNDQDETSPFLVQVNESSFNDNIPIDTIRIDQAASAAPFSIRALGFVNATIVEKTKVSLDLVELLFKEQYLNGNDMLRIKKHIENTCVYLKKNIEFCGMRCTVREMWSSGDIVTCGYVSDKTRLAFRSQSAMCTIYIQMSREMWEFDVNGEMYHEKAINFLGELFANWKNLTCTHDVTIALFSRIFYNAKSLEEFPSAIREDIKKDHKNRYFEDFYRVIYQNERYDDWAPTLVILKRLIKEYRDYVLNYHRRQLDIDGINDHLPECFLSSAPEGNFLETLNLSSSVFERHYIDRPFDRTGMMSLVITPGNGVFEANKDLTKITKERVIDNGIGSDLVCLGEQPLHAVPLFKYDTMEPSYGIPHWINLSFYKSSETIRYCNSSFLPSSKIKVKNPTKESLNAEKILPGYKVNKENYLKSLEETDDIFVNLSVRKINNDPFGPSKRIGSRVNTSLNFQNVSTNNQLLQTSISTNAISSKQLMNSKQRRFTSNLSSSFVNNETLPNIHNNINNTTNNNTTLLNNQSDDLIDDEDDDSSLDMESDSEQTYLTPNNEDTSNNSSSITKKIKLKVNPFAPSLIKPKMSFERRRWAHLFPLRDDGTPIFENVTVKTANEAADIDQPANSNSNNNLSPQSNGGGMASNQHKQHTNESASNISSSNPYLALNNERDSGLLGFQKASPDSNKFYDTHRKNYDYNNRKIISKNSFTNKTNWEINLDESMATMKTGVAWKSLTIPSCLPLTTDFFPSKNFEKNFVCSSNYTLLLDDDIREQYGYSNYGSEQNKIPMEKVFNDLVGHRLAMGFQMVVSKNSKDNSSSSSFMYDTSSISSFISRSSIKGYYKLSLGRIYHDLYYIVDPSNKTDYVKVEIYIPQQNKDRTLNKTIEYKYRFQVPDSKTYDISYCDMSRKSIESIKWNLIDSYICIQGNGSLTPNQLEKCWRQRLYLVPLMYIQNSKILNEQLNKPPSVNTLNNILEFQNLTPAQIPASYFENQQPIRCDIYQRKSFEELKFTRDFYFIRFMEGLNKLNRADDRRSYSKSTIAYLEAHNYNLNNCFTDMCLAVTGIMSSISSAQTYSSNISTNTNISNNLITQSTRSQLVSSVPPINTKQLQFEKLPSPKKQLLPLVSLYLNLTNSDSKSNQSSTSDYSSFRSTSNQNDNNNTTLLSSSSTSSLLSSTTTATTNMQNDANKLKTDILNILNNDYKVHMLNTQNGIPFIQNKKDIPLNCFISAEAVWWCIEHINEIENENDAILFLQICSDFDIIRHISNQQKIFIHGFYLYYIITNENRNHHLFTKDYCEVGFCHIEMGTESEIGNNLIHVNNLPPESAHTLPVTSNDMFNSYVNLFNKHSKTDFNNTTPESIMKLVNVDVDPNHKSNRVEWASAIYRSHYHQLCAFELEILWEMATGSLLADLISGYAKLANRFNYNLIAAPIDPFALPSNNNSDPLRGPIYIRLNLACLFKDNPIFENLIEKLDENSNSLNNFLTFIEKNGHSSEVFLNYLRKKFIDINLISKRALDESEFLKLEFQEYIEKKRMRHLQYLQEVILERYGFVRNAAIVKTLASDEDPYMFIHSSGGMFVLISNCYNNYSNRSRHASSNSSNPQQKTSNTQIKSKSSFTMNKSNNEPARERSNTKTLLNKKADENNDQLTVNNYTNNDNNNNNNNIGKPAKITLSIDSDVGFLWSWNFMLGKRWRNQYTGDESFQDNMLTDFRLFCSNKDERLEKFYNETKNLLL